MEGVMKQNSSMGSGYSDKNLKETPQEKEVLSVRMLECGEPEDNELFREVCGRGYDRIVVED